MEDIALPVKPLSRKKAAAHFDISKGTLDNWRARGCPCMQAYPGAMVFYDPVRVTEWLRKEYSPS